MTHSNQSVVKDYLNNLLFDFIGPDTQSPLHIEPTDSIEISHRLLPCFDPFKLMNINHSFNVLHAWLVFISLLKVAKDLPAGRVKGYCLQQCQILLNQLKLQGM